MTPRSLAKGFCLTVAEAMWKSRPVVASAVGGILRVQERFLSERELTEWAQVLQRADAP